MAVELLLIQQQLEADRRRRDEEDNRRKAEEAAREDAYQAELLALKRKYGKAVPFSGYSSTMAPDPYFTSTHT